MNSVIKSIGRKCRVCQKSCVVSVVSLLLLASCTMVLDRKTGSHLGEGVVRLEEVSVVGDLSEMESLRTQIPPQISPEK